MGEKEGKEVRDLSEAAMEEAKLDAGEASLRFLVRAVVDLWALTEMLDLDRSREGIEPSWSILLALVSVAHAHATLTWSR